MVEKYQGEKEGSIFLLLFFNLVAKEEAKILVLEYLDRKGGSVSTTPRESNTVILIPSIWYFSMSPCKITIKAKNT